MPIQNLSTHPGRYVTVADLAEYWAVSRKQIHKHIDSGMLAAIRLGSRLYRVRAEAALDFEHQVRVASTANGNGAGRVVSGVRPAPRIKELPSKVGLQRVRGSFGGD